MRNIGGKSEIVMGEEIRKEEKKSGGDEREREREKE